MDLGIISNIHPLFKLALGIRSDEVVGVLELPS